MCRFAYIMWFSRPEIDRVPKQIYNDAWNAFRMALPAKSYFLVGKGIRGK